MRISSLCTFHAALALIACTSRTGVPVVDSSTGSDTLTIFDSGADVPNAQPDARNTDSGRPMDSGADARDSSAPDTRVLDTGFPDTRVTDSGRDTGRPDSGLVDTFRPPVDAGSPRDLALDSFNQLRATTLEQCRCLPDGFASADDCATVFTPNTTYCDEQAIMASELGAYFACSNRAQENYAMCLAAAACSELAAEDCGFLLEDARSACGEPDALSVSIFQASWMDCYANHILGVGGTCPEATTTSSGVGAAVFMGTTIGAGDDVEGACSAAGAPDRAHRWVAPSTGRFTIDTFGSGFDTVLVVRSTCIGADIACDDDAPDFDSVAGGFPMGTTTGFRSEVTIDAVMGTEYLVIVDGYAGPDAPPSYGEYVVNIRAASMTGDAGVADSSVTDSSTVDAGVIDSSTPDALAPDAGG